MTSPHPIPMFNDAATIALVVNGEMNDYSLIKKFVLQYDRCVAVDGGLKHCQKMSIRPDLIIGDCDSIAEELLSNYRDIPIQVFPVDKDDTDTALAIKLVNHEHVKKIGLFGAFGLRIDHSLGNLYLMSNFPEKVIIETEKETTFIIQGEYTLHCKPGQTLSLIPLGDRATGVYTEGLKWNLTDATLDNHFHSLSNICVETTVNIKINKGQLMCNLLRDAK